MSDHEIKIEGPVSQAEIDVLRERRRQVSEEGWKPDMDDVFHYGGQLAYAAAAYAVHAANPAAQIDIKVGRRGEFFNGGWMGLPRLLWPKEWDWAKWFKPSDPRRSLVKAGALIVAEIERLDRAAARESERRQAQPPGPSAPPGPVPPRVA